MSIDWPFADSVLSLGGADKQQDQQRIHPTDAARQTETTEAILQGFVDRPGILLSDEVGLGKTYVALATAASTIIATKGQQGPVVIMVPGRLRRKWQREWQQFKLHCAKKSSLDWIRDTYAHSPTDFFKLLDDPAQHRSQLIFITTGCFSRGVNDTWIKLAMIRLARQKTRLSDQQKRAIYRWAPDLVRQTTNRYLTEAVIGKLMNSDVLHWKQLLVRERLLDEDSDDPVPELLSQVKDKIDWSGLVLVLRESLPKRTSENIKQRMKVIRSEFNDACQSIYAQWLRLSKWYSPLLILDEAHHAKNDHTKLARLFRRSSADDVSLLLGKFQRMLFLTATPFQLGHEELIRVIRSFDAIRWKSPRAPAKSREEILVEIEQLAAALDANRLAGRRLDRLWSTIRPEMLGDYDVGNWWSQVEHAPRDPWEIRLVEYVNDCRETRDRAQSLLRPWVIRHNRPQTLPATDGKPPCPRRLGIYGQAIRHDGNVAEHGEHGLPVARESALPFLLTARAQGELAQTSGARAFFAEGLASSYEAFHHTRTARGKARDMEDDGRPVEEIANKDDESLIVPSAWYEQQIAQIIPSRDAPRSLRLAHPKVSATVQRVLELWTGGEKVLVFCFYRETCRALYEHIREEINERTLRIAGDKLGGDYRNDPAKTQEFLARIARRCSEEGRPFHEEVRRVLSRPFERDKYRVFTEDQKRQLIEVLAAYFRAPSFLARYLPLDDPDVQRAWELGEGRREILEPGIRALRRGVEEQTDQSNQTYMSRAEQFLDFAIELAERSQCDNDPTFDNDEDERLDPLKECLDAVTIYSRPRRPEDLESDDQPEESDTDDGSYRVVPLVRIVHGDTKPETRDRLALAFNSPLFPEVLVSSSVMGEGIDLHRFCRHVIHHDGYWNPSTLEQQTGRLDRIRCKAEFCRMSIRVYQPFIAGSADEKMFRVVRDRERWFQIVMGQKFEFDERTSEELATRVPLPETLAKQLTFDLSRWKD
jgi:hypothetical protein